MPKFPISTQVKPYQGKPTLWVNNEPIYPYLYTLTESPGSNRSWEFMPQYNIAKFAKSGVRLFGADIWFDEMWPEDAEDFSIEFTQKQIDGFVQVCPDAMVLLRVHTNPPAWWVDAHPEEQTIYANTCTLPREPISEHENKVVPDTLNAVQCSLASTLWLEVMGEKFAQFVQRLAKTPQGDHLLGIHIASGVHGENHYWGFQQHDPDVGICMQKAFRKYLQSVYPTDEALQTAWHDAGVTLETATVPGMERHNAVFGMFRDPAHEQRTIDYYIYQHLTITDALIHFAKIIKKNWPRPLITGTFYGYYLSLFGRHAAGGHLAEQEILTCPDIDFLAGSMAYGDMYRPLGMPALSHDLVESVQLHGKLFLDEMDQGTHVGSIMGGIPLYDKNTSRHLITRGIAMGFLRGAGSWYYDYGVHGLGGWWDHPEYQYEVRRVGQVFGEYFNKPLGQAADVLMVHDTKVFYYTASNPANDPITERLAVDNFISAAFRSGVSVNSVYFSDLDLVDLTRYKCIVFANTFLMTEKQRQFVLEKVKGKQVLWFTAPAYIDPKCLDILHIEEMTGMKMSEYPCKALPEMTINCDFLPPMQYGGEPIAKLGLPRNQVSRPDVTLFTVEDPDATPLAAFENGRIAMAVKENSWFASIPIIDPTILREIFRKCGAHIYTEGGDTLLAGNGLVMIHVNEPGHRKITLKNGKVLSLRLEKGGTTIVDAETGAVVLD